MIGAHVRCSNKRLKLRSQAPISQRAQRKRINWMDAMNAIFKEYFPKNPPARTTVQVIQDQLEQVQVVAVR